jgi:hypothetical protein
MSERYNGLVVWDACDYMVLESFSTSDLTDQVAFRLKQGWKLYGAPFTRSSNNSMLCQAMVKISPYV